MRILQTARLSLEPQVAAHAEAMFAVLSDPAIYEYENEPPESVEWLRARFARLESRRSAAGDEAWLNWVVRHEGEPGGYVQATVHGDGTASIAYVFGSRWWGRGLAREAVGAMVAELRESHGVHTFRAVLKKGNARSLRLLQRVGFVEGEDRSDLEPGELRMESVPIHSSVRRP